MRVVVALGGNALLRRGQKLTDKNQRKNMGIACDQLAPIALEHELVVSHGNGPQVGLLALQGGTVAGIPPSSLDVLGAGTQGTIGYIVEQELGNRLPFDRPLATLLTMVEVDPDDPAFENPTKPIGPFYDREQALTLVDKKGWRFTSDNDAYRRVVPSPRPKQIFELRQIHWMLEHGAVVICAGGGGVPTTFNAEGKLVGVEAVIDKDYTSGFLAAGLNADFLVIATDVDGVYLDWKLSTRHAIDRAHPDALLAMQEDFPEGSMRPKVVAACEFALATGNPAAIGALSDVRGMLNRATGTLVTTEATGITYRDT